MLNSNYFSPFIERYLGAPVIKGPSYVDLLPPSSPADDSGSSLRTGFHQIIQIWGEFFLGLGPEGVEDVGVICAVHQLATGLFVTAAAV